MREVEARLRLSAVDRTAKAFAAVQQRLDRVEKQSHRINKINEAVSRSSNRAVSAISGGLAPAALAYGVGRAVVRYASVERQIARIGITAGASADETKAAFGTIQKAAQDYAMSQDDVTAGLDTLVASGRSLQDALSFLPSVTATAQASGAAVEDIASSADALGRNFKISGGEMQRAFDTLVEGGKAGQFELKDMARYLPSLAPSFAALGYKGEAGLEKMVALLQTLRAGTGTAEEAATAASNIFSKIESDETAKKFSKFGVDLRKEMKGARRDGKDLLEFFVDLTRKTVKGDLSKLPQLFTDTQMATGMRALLNNGELLAQVLKQVGAAAGATKRDLDRVLAGTQSRLDRLSTSWDTFLQNVGSGASSVLVPALDRINQEVDERRSYDAGIDRGKESGDTLDTMSKRYGDLYKQMHEGEEYSPLKAIEAFRHDLGRYGKGEIDSPEAELRGAVRAKKRGAAVYPPMPGYANAPIPTARPDPRIPIEPRGVYGPPMPPQVIASSDVVEVAGRSVINATQDRIAAAARVPLAEDVQSYGIVQAIKDGFSAIGSAIVRPAYGGDAYPKGFDPGRFGDGAAILSGVDAIAAALTDGAEKIRLASEGRGDRIDASGFDPGRFGGADQAMQGADALRQALEGGSETAGATLQASGAEAASAIKEAAQMLLNAAAAIGANGREAAAAISSARPQSPRPMQGPPMAASRNLGVTMPDAGTPGG